MEKKTTHIVKSSAAAMPASCWGTYRRVAVLEEEIGPNGPVQPAMISDRARGVVRVVRTWERCSARGGDRTAFARAMREAEALAAALNGGEQ